MGPFRLTADQEQCLRDQVITADRPGPVLRDFQVILEFLGPDGVEAAGKANLLPIRCIGELDPRLSRPLRLELKRPLIRSHPYLWGLNLLLRASGLGRVEGAGAKARLALDPTMMDAWDRLNPTERYFHLLEAWLRFGRAEMVGERGPAWGDLLLYCLQAWRGIPERGYRLDVERPNEAYMPGIGRDYYLLALMDLFGLVAVELPPRPVAPWTPAGVGRVPFGDAVFTLLAAAVLDPPSGPDLPWEQDEDGEGDAAGGPRFGALQPLFRPYFPEWRQTLELPEPEPREGTFVFRVSLGKVWRRIAMPSEATLDDLVALILRSVGFDSDHLYQFTYRDRLGALAHVTHPEMDEGPWADEITIGSLPLEPSQTMELTYDFGDHWEFAVALERIEPPGDQAQGPRILERHGKAPPQYGDWDE